MREREAIAAALRALPGVVAIEGEPGIGKSRLLAHLIASADRFTVLGARASEFERDLPYALWSEALDADVAASGGRHGTHRALRARLEELATPRPAVLWMDDVQWADPESIDALAALVRRPPASPVLIALAAREGQMPAPLAAALAHGATTLSLAPLTAAEAAELVGPQAGALYPVAGGNPFYLEQLARFPPGPEGVAGAEDGLVPPAVAAALAAELASLAPEPRRLLDAAAVAGDPFEPGLAAAVAELPEPAALQALDELLLRGLVRPAGAPRRFAFRHPVVRHAVYVAAGGGWRLGAHARAAAELERRGAGAVTLAHHVEHAARPGDEDAIALLSTAATELQAWAPATAARFHAAALRLLPDADRERRTTTQRLLADAQAAAGDPVGARATLDDALAGAGPADRLALTVALANLEWWIGGHEDARRRLHVALGELPAEPSPDRVRLRLALSLMALLACELDEALAHTADARHDARAIGDPAFEIAALASGVLAAVSAGGGPERLDESSAALERLTAAQLATRLPTFWMHGRARRGLGQLDASLADLQRGAELAERTGRERVLVILTIESVATLIELGRIADATAVAEEGVERARLAGNARILLWAQCARASARLAAGDVAAALQDAGEAAATGTQADFHAAGQPGWILGAALVAAGNPERGRDQLLDALPAVLPVDRPAATADLVEAHLACGDVDAAEQALAAPVLDIARSAVLLARGRPREAVDAARTAPPARRSSRPARGSPRAARSRPRANATRPARR